MAKTNNQHEGQKAIHIWVDEYLYEKFNKLIDQDEEFQNKTDFFRAKIRQYVKDNEDWRIGKKLANILRDTSLSYEDRLTLIQDTYEREVLGKKYKKDGFDIGIDTKE